MHILAWVLLLAVIIILVVLIATMLHHLMLGTPYVRTSTRIARVMAAMAKLQPGERVYDLGAGDGSILIEAKRQVPGIHAIGVELVPLIWLLGWLRSRIRGITFLRKDARHVHIADANAVFLYMTPKALREMEPVFRTLQKGARVVSRAFHLPGRTPDEERVAGNTKLFLYRF